MVIKIGIIGCGIIAQAHLEAYSKIQEVEVVAVCSRTEESACGCAKKWNIPDFYTDFHQMLKRTDIVAVDICVHNNLHAPIAIAALNAGKHVYCEKPLAGSYADGLAMVQAAERNERTLHVQLATLYEPYMRGAKRLVDGGALGKLYHGRAMAFRRRSRPYVDGYGTPAFVQKVNASGGALYDFGVYQIAALLYLMGLPTPTRFSGSLYQNIPMNEERRDNSHYDVEELGVGLVHFKGGITMDIFASWATHLDTMDPTTLLGNLGGIKLNPFSFHTTICDMELDCTGNLNTMDYRWKNTLPNEDAYCSSEAHWIAALTGRVPLLPTGEMTLQTLLIQDGITLSHQLGREVTCEEVILASKSTALKL